MPDDELSAKVANARARLLGSRAAVEAGSPWPLAERFDNAPEASWGPPEVLAHVAEMVGYWTAELDRVAAGTADSAPVPFGRIATDPVRLAAIERDRRLLPAELYARVDSALDRFAVQWSAWTEDERARLGVHPTLGEFTVSAVADRFVAGHLADHAAQLESILDPAPEAD